MSDFLGGGEAEVTGQARVEGMVHEIIPADDDLEMCEGCMFCNPYDYTIEVDAFFLRVVRDALKSLAEKAPDHSAPGWLDQCEQYIRAIEMKYGQKIDF